jgi:hypothetical protein
LFAVELVASLQTQIAETLECLLGARSCVSRAESLFVDLVIDLMDCGEDFAVLSVGKDLREFILDWLESKEENEKNERRPDWIRMDLHNGEDVWHEVDARKESAVNH